MALLTLVINGTTGAALLKRLGLLDQTPAQLRHVNDARRGVIAKNDSNREHSLPSW